MKLFCLSLLRRNQTASSNSQPKEEMGEPPPLHSRQYSILAQDFHALTANLAASRLMRTMDSQVAAAAWN